MTVRECYAQMDGDYADVQRRLRNDERIEKYLKKFLEDSNFASLCAAMEEKDYKNGFVYVHNLKGICCNLGITHLAQAAGSLCEELRGNDVSEQISALFDKTKKNYAQTVEAIHCLDTE